ncbi:MAG: hypothetical protein AAFX58_05810 [Pseudomonadota bacterium]
MAENSRLPSTGAGASCADLAGAADYLIPVAQGMLSALLASGTIALVDSAALRENENMGTLTYIHVLLLVFWVGTDLGVFLCARRLQNPALSLETRHSLLETAMLLDRLPRSCFVLIMPVGLQLAAMGGWMSVNPAVLTAAWVIAAVWLALLWTTFLNEQAAFANKLRLADKLLQVAVLLGFGWLGISGLMAGGIDMPAWLAWKCLLIAAIALTAIMIDVAFAPFVAAFAELMQGGTTPAIESAIDRSLAHAYVWVFATYVLALAAGWFGTVKGV